MGCEARSSQRLVSFPSGAIASLLTSFNLFKLAFFAPAEPVECYLGAHDGENQGEDAVLEVVAPGGVDQDAG